jgi:hypothetical protein
MRELLSEIVDDVGIMRAASSHVYLVDTARRPPSLVNFR